MCSLSSICGSYATGFGGSWTAIGGSGNRTLVLGCFVAGGVLVAGRQEPQPTESKLLVSGAGSH